MALQLSFHFIFSVVMAVLFLQYFFRHLNFPLQVAQREEVEALIAVVVAPFALPFTQYLLCARRWDRLVEQEALISRH